MKNDSCPWRDKNKRTVEIAELKDTDQKIGGSAKGAKKEETSMS